MWYTPALFVVGWQDVAMAKIKINSRLVSMAMLHATYCKLSVFSESIGYEFKKYVINGCREFSPIT